ncbi:g protein-coupled receptor [Anaeramoeba ignava]|uniref:G protein-coupled receptor n=1 Tax=Anaeramoeba ignava TaxID=1746090 RepID=A0A9Q0LMZ6_ANAIG|nr:g protein-coupled receptor [Anaeramoeba ignava]
MVHYGTVADLLGVSLGIFGSSTIIFVHFKFPELRTFYRKLVFILSVYDLITALIYSLPGYYNHFICKIQPIFIIFFVATAAFWNAVISIITFFTVIKRTPVKTLDKFQKICHIILLVISSTMAIILIIFYHPEYNGDSYWCWVKEIKITIMIYSVWWSYALISVLFYITTVIKIRKIFRDISTIRDHDLRKKQRKEAKIQLRMTMIPIIYILVIFPTSFKRARQMANQNAKPWFVLDMFQAFFLSTQGFWDSILFVFLIKRVRVKLFALCSCSKQKRAVITAIPLSKDEIDYERFRNSSEDSNSDSDSKPINDGQK